MKILGSLFKGCFLPKEISHSSGLILTGLGLVEGQATKIESATSLKGKTRASSSFSNEEKGVDQEFSEDISPSFRYASNSPFLPCFDRALVLEEQQGTKCREISSIFWLSVEVNTISSTDSRLEEISSIFQ